MARSQLGDLAECRECISLAVRTASRRLTQLYDRALGEAGLRSTQFNLLVMVHEMHQPNINALARMLGSDPTTVTRNVQGLIKRRLLAASAGKDLRERKVAVTRRGEAMLRKAARPRCKTHHQNRQQFHLRPRL